MLAINVPLRARRHCAQCKTRCLQDRRARPSLTHLTDVCRRLFGTQRQEPLQFKLPGGALGRLQVQVQTVLALLAIRHLDEQQTLGAIGGGDHALLVAGLVRVVRVFDEPEHLPPENR